MVDGVDMLVDMADMALAPNCPVHGFSSPPTQTDIKPITPAPAGTSSLPNGLYVRVLERRVVLINASMHTASESPNKRGNPAQSTRSTSGQVVRLSPRRRSAAL